ncbi:MAG: methylated-DNA--[protein]-cysteine S-methyltransferase [Halothiobacillus sp.]
MTLKFTAVTAAIGTLYAVFSDAGLCHITLGLEQDCVATIRRRTGITPMRADAELIAFSQQISVLFTENTRYAAPISLAGLTPFQQQVLEITAQIPPGQVRSYGFIARVIGKPQASRAVGSALAKNPLPFVIPCHRVIHADGTLGAYSGGGTALKARLLEREGVNLITNRHSIRVKTPFDVALNSV